MRHRFIKAVGAALLVLAASRGALAAPTPGALLPVRVAGSGLNVVDLEAQKAWYMSKLGMRVLATYGPAAKPYEYVMTIGDGSSGAVLALLKTKRPDGPNGFSRVILLAPDAKALAQHLATEGVAMREVVPGSAYFITDPEGNAVELFQPPAPK